MNQTATGVRVSEKKMIGTILLATLVAGTLDITAASIQFYINTKRGPVPIFHYIASALFGEQGKTGTGMAIEGLLLHYVIAFLFTLFFFLLFPQIKVLAKNLFVTGMLYGLFAWAVMNLVVVRLSRIPTRPIDWSKAWIGMLILMFCIGLPIALIVGRYYLNRGRRIFAG